MKPEFKIGKGRSLCNVLLCTGMVFFLTPTGGFAAQWRMIPEVKVYLNYNDNVFLSADEPLESYEAQISPIMRIDRKTEASNSRFLVRLDSNKYSESNKQLDSNDARVFLNSDYSGERNLAGIELGYIRDTTLTSELEPDGSGRVATNERREKAYAKPYWQYLLTERSSFKLAYTGNDVRYDIKDGDILTGESNLQDYTYQDASATYQYQWSERAAFNFLLSASRYDTDGPLSFVTSDTYSGQLGFDYQFSGTLRTSLLAGYRDTKQSQTIKIGDFEIEQPGIDASGSIYYFNINKAFEQSTIDFTLSRVLTPTSNGNLDISDRLDFLLNHKMSQAVTLVLKVYTSRNQDSVDSAESASADTERLYYFVRPGIDWRIAKSWYTSLTYTHRRQTRKFPTASDETLRLNAYGNMISWSISYRTPI
jgi:hypothetical protein